MIDHLKQELNTANQVVESLAELLRSLYSLGDMTPEGAEEIEDLFQELDLDL